MISKKKALSSSGDIVLVRTKKNIRCWYCQLHGDNVLDKWGCCKRCGTNLKKWSKRGKLIYPSLNDEKLAQEVLGTRERCDIPPPEHNDSALDTIRTYTSERERLPGKVNHCKICWQKTLIFIWSTSRVINKEKLEKIEQFKDVVNLERLAHPICWACVKEHDLLKEEKENGT